MYLIFDWSDISLCSPVNRVWKVKLYIWREVGCAISWDIVYTTETVHQLCKLNSVLQSKEDIY